MALFSLPLWQILLLFLPVLPIFYCIYHAASHEFPQPAEKFLWVFACALLPILGAVLYLLFGLRRAQKISA